MPRRPLRSVRARATAAACLVVATFSVFASLAFLRLLRASLVEEVDVAARELVRDVAAEAEQGLLPERFPGTTETFVQVVRSDGTIRARSENLREEPVMAGPPPTRLEIRTLESPPAAPPGDYRVAAMTVPTPEGPLAIYVGRSLRGPERELVEVGALLAGGLPLLVALVGGTTWVLVGRALRPVESIRQEVADITASDLHRRVQEPGTGDEVDRLADTMNAMLDRLELAVERQRRFVDDASHELQSPLASLRADLELALARPDRSDWAATATRLLGDVDRQERLVGDLLFLARGDAGLARRTMSLVDLDDVVLDEVERGRGRWAVPVDVQAVSAAPVRGRAEDLTRLVANLLSNAARHAASAVTVELGVEDGVARLVVADDGPGISPDVRSRIFERFARLDSGRSRRRGGTGLGLAIAREIVEAHGGTIAVVDTEAGACLVVRLPAAG